MFEKARNDSTGKEFTRILNPHWAEFYYGAMLFCKTVVVVLDDGWQDNKSRWNSPIMRQPWKPSAESEPEP